MAGGSISSGVGGVLGDFGGAASDLIAAGGYSQEADTYREAAKTIGQAVGLEKQNEAITKASTGIQEVQQQRELYQSMSTSTAVAGAGGIATSGSVSDVLRSSAQQGALTKQLIGAQGEINVNAEAIAATGFKAQQQAYIGQADAADAQAQAAQAGGASDILGGIIGIAGLAFGL